MIRKLKYHCLPSNDLLTIFTSFVCSILEYGAPVWSSGITKQQRNAVEFIRKRACRLNLGPNYCSYLDALRDYGLESLAKDVNNFIVLS